MEKVFEALKCIDVLKEDGCITTLYQGKALETIKQSLLELKAIKEAKPSEALEMLEGIEYVADVLKVNHKIGSRDCANQEIKEMVERLYYRIPIIKQALIKAQENEKSLETIKNHLSFKDAGIETYNNQTKYLLEIESKDTGATIHIHLETKEEFDLLKEVLK